MTTIEIQQDVHLRSKNFLDERVTRWKNELYKYASPEKAKILSKFFKTGKGEYGEGDKFLGIVVPDTRRVTKLHFNEDIRVITEMIKSDEHEYRLSGLLALVMKYQKCVKQLTKAPTAKIGENKTVAELAIAKEEIIDTYIKLKQRINNWDLVDLSAPYILGEELCHGQHTDTLKRLSNSQSLWDKRIAIVATLTPTRRGILCYAEDMISQHIGESHDLLHKAVGWVMREIGKKDMDKLCEMLTMLIDKISATSLSYATEKMTADQRKYWQRQRRISQNVR